ncbi:MAG: hypothetical protein M1833_000276 [Piccolia ochrophora]|nr:MAG: hypothetical protein M1833_000276 [Piccolia ochrophora]
MNGDAYSSRGKTSPTIGSGTPLLGTTIPLEVAERIIETENGAMIETETEIEIDVARVHQGTEALDRRGVSQKWILIPRVAIIGRESARTGTPAENDATIVVGTGTEGLLDVMHAAMTTNDLLGGKGISSKTDHVVAGESVTHSGVGVVVVEEEEEEEEEVVVEPTPDLTDTVPILDRKRRLTQWDIKPPGYENVTAEQAKLSGMFPLPGAPRQQPMDPSRLQAFMAQPSGGVSNAALKPSNARQSKRLFVHNVPPSASEEAIIQFFNLQLNGLNVVESSDPCISAQMSTAKDFALLEFKTPPEATVALALDSISMDEGDGMETSNGALNGNARGLSIKRPKDYIVPAVTDDTNYEPGVVSNIVPDTQNKISVSNIPLYLTDEQVTELLVSFGELKAFILAKDNSTGESRGIAFCEYVDPAATDIAVEGLNGMELGDKHLRVARASIGVQQASGLEMGVNAMSMLAGTTSTDVEEGRVLQLLNMVTPEELMDNDEYEGMAFLSPTQSEILKRWLSEICEDIKEECEKFGPVLDMKIPRPAGGSRQSNGVGKIFVKFDTPESAGKALRSLAGRKFADRTVVTTFFSEDNFEVNAW